jgi:hypothetical protein
LFFQTSCDLHSDMGTVRPTVMVMGLLAFMAFLSETTHHSRQAFEACMHSVLPHGTDGRWQACNYYVVDTVVVLALCWVAARQCGGQSGAWAAVQNYWA